MEAFIALATLVLTSNITISGIKWLWRRSLSTAGLRALLGLVSLVGVFAYAAFTGDPIDLDSVSQLATAALEAIGVAFGAHLSFKAIKYS
jgi:type IV secretory pathway TrbL component